MHEQLLQEQLDGLTKQLEDFKNSLAEQGYKLKNDKISKLPDVFYFMEIGFVGESQYEDSGHYKMYREFISLDDDLLPQILQISKILDCEEREKKAREFLISLLTGEYEDDKEDTYSKYFDNFNSALDEIHGYCIGQSEEIGYIDVRHYYYPELLIDAELKSSYDNWHGYISFIVAKTDLTKYNVDFEFSKFFRENHPWREK